MNHIAEETRGDFIGASGFLLAQVDVAARNATTNAAPVSVHLIPNVGELAVEARDGTLLQRSHVALFAGLARRPRSGNRAHNKAAQTETSPYIPIPDECVGSQCGRGIQPEYTFTSSRPEVGDFVERNLQSADPRAVTLGTNGKPIPNSHSGLFCAYNAGTTTVTLSTGGRAFSLPVTVQAGSVRQPCGTVPLNEVRPNQTSSAPAPPPAPAPASGSPLASSTPLAPPPPPPAAVVPTPAHPAAPAPVAFITPAAQPAFLPPFLPVPLPTPARPTPPSGTSAVEAAQREEEEEAAPDSVSNQAVAYRASEHEPAPAYVLGMVVLAALAGVAAVGRRGRPRRRVAPVVLSSAREQERADPRYPRRRRW